MKLPALTKYFILLSTCFALSSGNRGHRKLHPDHERQFLAALGLSKVPTLSKHKIEIPDILREQYYQQTGLDVDTSSFRAPGSHTAYANTVRSFPGRLISKASGGIEKEAIFDFDFTKEPYDGDSSEAVQSAILKAYWKPHLTIKRTTGSFKVRIYDLLKMSKLEKMEDDSEKSESDDMLQIKMLMDIKKIYHRDADRDEGWYEFDVTPAVQRWVLRNPKNFQLILEKGEMKVKGFASHVLPNGVFEHAMILVYSEDSRSQEQRDATRRKRRSAASNAEEMQRKMRKKVRKRKGGRKFCKRHPLNVDFAEVGWNDWIVAPPGYDANFCHGECPLQLSDHLNTTNHAIVQTLVNSVNPSAVPRSCCVPTELSPISMLYLDEYEKVVLKNYENMVVEGCGCR